ncbi:hypothetical protein B0H16DRAFT_1789237 [Mycena metata]|uniref:DUF6818 domain-containing protein n=1 Tax=Mycena metata TaxID=1033252 RepID=A0AAD7NN50_9AGAR|nr:hypothetical protein B0H16DRAFT_1789237 [Mycena metata]
MSDPTASSFSQTPEFHYDAAGKPWYRDGNGTWVPATMAPPRAPQLPSPVFNATPSAPARDQYNFSATFAPPAPPPGPLIDPRLMPLRAKDDDNDDKGFDAAAVAKSRGLKPAFKVGGVRQVEKHKKRAHVSDSDDAPAAKRPGRMDAVTVFTGGTGPTAVPVYGTVIIPTCALDLVEKKRPIGAKGWKSVARSFNKWAKKSNWPTRDEKSLQAKYKGLLRSKKPTGSSRCPPEIKRALRIEQLISERAGTREVSDGAMSDDDNTGASSDSSVEVLGSKKAAKVHTAIARRAPSPPLRRNPRLNAPELVGHLAKAFDPEVQQARDEERSQRSFQLAQFNSISAQLCDAQAATESLCTQLLSMQNRSHEVERARDLAEFKLQLLEQRTVVSQPQPQPQPQPRQSRQGWYEEHHPDLIRVDGKVRYPSNDEKENWPPYGYPRSSSPLLSSSPDLSTNPSDVPIASPSSAGAGSSTDGAVNEAA